MKQDALELIARLDEETAARPRFTRGFALVIVALGFLYILFVLAAILAAGWAIGLWLPRQHEPQFLILLVPSVLVLFVSVVNACFAQQGHRFMYGSLDVTDLMSHIERTRMVR